MIKKRVLAAIAVALILVVFFFRPANPFDGSQVRVTISEGETARSVEASLKANKIITQHSAFLFTLKLLNLGDRLKAGDYFLSPSDPLLSVIAKLVGGQTVPEEEVRVSFPEGMSIYKMGLALKEKGFKHWKQFQGLVSEGIKADLRQRHWGTFKYIPSESLEGYLFPDTYNFFLDASAETMAETMVSRFEQVIGPFWNENKGKTRLTLHEALTLASIVEKEAKKPEERPIIASVFFNRLKIGMPLAADPTVKYALERPSKRVYLDQLSVKSPYNTYKVRGLPPGPICNPGLDSFKAVIFPAKTDYLFFVAKKDGSHIFSRTWQQHQRARAKAQ